PGRIWNRRRPAAQRRSKRTARRGAPSNCGSGIADCRFYVAFYSLVEKGLAFALARIVHTNPKRQRGRAAHARPRWRFGVVIHAATLGIVSNLSLRVFARAISRSQSPSRSRSP